MDQVEELLERARELHHQGDINGALCCTYEAVNHLTKEFREANGTPKTTVYNVLENTPC